jgi:putative ABC transport system permease protein
MLGYYIDLAVRSLKRSPGLTLLMILAVGFGVAASMTTYSVFRAVSGDPIPWKSSQLYVPQIEMWGPKGHGGDGDNGDPPDAMDYTDAIDFAVAGSCTSWQASHQCRRTCRL